MRGGGGWFGFHVSGFGTNAWPWFTEFMGGSSNFPLGVKNTLNGGDIPVAWINTKYRMVYVNYGHGDQIYSAPPLPAMLDNILRWLLSQ